MMRGSGARRVASLSVASVNSNGNGDIRDVIGNKSDEGYEQTAPSIAGMLHTISEHLHHSSKCYPTLANGVAVAGGAGAWELGDFVEIVPANTIDDYFDIHYVVIESLSVADTFQIQLYAAEILIGSIRATKTAVQDSTLAIPISTPILDANTQIQAKVASSSGGDSATISLHYHTY